ERGLLPEISSLLTGKEKINGVRVTRAVMAGEAFHRDAKKHASNFRRDFVSPVQTVERLQRVTIRNKDATRVRVRRGIEVHSRRLPAEIFSARGNDVVEHIVVGTIRLEPGLC